MGAKDSKPCFITYDEAVKRVSESELRRIREAFKKSTGSTTEVPLSKDAFIHDVLGDGVPAIVGDRLFAPCGGTRRGIAFKDLLCGLVVLTKGTQEERIKFLWTLYCNEACTHIVKWDLITALQAESTSLQTNHAWITTESLTALFGRGERVDQDQFRSWLLMRKDATVLSRWLLLEPCVSLTSDLETPTFYQTLAGVTHLEERDICALEKCFWGLRARAGSGQLDAEVLAPLLSPPVPRAALRGLLLALDENRDGHIDFKELCCGLSAACRGPTCERVKFCFKVFDTDRDGFLNQSELQHMVNILCFVANESLRNQNMHSQSYQPTVVFEALRQRICGENTDNSSAKVSRDENADDSFASEVNNVGNLEDFTRFSKDFIDIESNGDSMLGYAARLDYSKGSLEFQEKESFEAELEKDSEKEWGLSQEDFLIWSVERAEALVAPFLQLIFEVCHIVLGLRPQCKHQEQDIVLGWLLREVKRGYSVGQFWYLISTEWWSLWLSYSSNGASATACSACGRAAARNANPLAAHALDEAIVCDESFNSAESMGDLLGRAETGSMGSGSSSSGVSSSSSSKSSRHPGHIDNSRLLAKNPYQVKTLTGEGGHLRTDLTLSQHHDFELVPDSLWKAMAHWYGGPQPLPRQVIKPPSSDDVELELYPRILRLLRHTAPEPTNNNTSASGSSWSGMVGGYGAAALSSVGMASYPNSTPATPNRYLAYTAAFSRLSTIRQVCEFICSQLHLAREDVRLWMVPAGSGTSIGGSAGELLEDESKTLSELNAADGQRVLVEVRNKDLTWPEELRALSRQAVENRGLLVGSGVSALHPAGATGLNNLGNTCFMNAALQAVWNTGPLTMYFTHEMHLYELNLDNPHGTGGALAQRYGELCKQVWSSGARSVAPIRVRWCVARHASRFGGGGQHDSQELLAWLLDALHEDLNRIPPIGMPYAELRDSDGRPDQEVAQEAWEQHTARNQSIITELFYGQLKSKVTCASCGHESVRFDPFNMLSLPLPMESYILVEVLVILLDGSVPIKYGIRLNSEDNYRNLKLHLSPMCSVAPSRLLLAEGGCSAFGFKSPSDNNRVKADTAGRLLAYELPDEDEEFADEGGEDIIGIPDDVNARGDASGANNDEELIDGKALVGVPPTERLSSSSDSCDSATANNFHNAKNMKSTNSDGSPGYMSIQGKSTPNSSNENTITKTTDVKGLANYDVAQRKYSPRGSPLPIVRDMANKTNSPTAKMKFIKNGDLGSNPGRVLTKTLSKDEALVFSSETAPKKNGNSSLKGIPQDTIRRIELKPALTTVNSSSRLSQMGDASGKRMSKKCFLMAVHRKQSRQELYFLSQHKRRWEVFGCPLVVEARCGSSGRSLYSGVWRQVERLLSAPPPVPPDQANHATDCDDSLGYTFPFTLRVVSRGGGRCAVCPWTRFCRGCALPCTDEALLFNLDGLPVTPSAATDTLHQPTSTPASPRLGRLYPGGKGIKGISDQTVIDEGPERCPEESILDRLDFAELPDKGSDTLIAIDWDPTALHLRYQSNRERAYIDHKSINECRRLHTAPVELSHCLRAFTSEERLEERYKCAVCRDHQPATKKLQIWRLPPILIIHLKRFQYVNNKWIKSQKVVNFPYEDFDPTAFLASVPQETILRHADLSLHRANKLLRIPNENDESIEEIDYSCVSDSEEINGSCELTNDTRKIDSVSSTSNLAKRSTNEDDQRSDMLSKINEDTSNISSVPERFRRGSTNRKGSVIVSTRERLESTSLIKTPVIDDNFEDYHQHKLKPDEDPFDLKYRLYSVVSHSGMMNGGHYVAYAQNPNGTWYCYNDSSCKDLASPPAIDPSSAYMLFYQRTGLDYKPYLPNTDGKTPVPGLSDPTDGENSDLKKIKKLPPSHTQSASATLSKFVSHVFASV